MKIIAPLLQALLITAVSSASAASLGQTLARLNSAGGPLKIVSNAESLNAQIAGDPRRTRRALQGVLSDAASRRDHGRPARLSLTVRRDLARVILVLTADGAGLSVADIIAAYGPAGDADRGGLGESVRLAKALGGSLNVDSELGRRAVYTLELPIEPTHSAMTASR